MRKLRCTHIRLSTTSPAEKACAAWWLLHTIINARWLWGARQQCGHHLRSEKTYSAQVMRTSCRKWNSMLLRNQRIGSAQSPLWLSPTGQRQRLAKTFVRMGERIEEVRKPKQRHIGRSGLKHAAGYRAAALRKRDSRFLLRSVLEKEGLPACPRLGVKWATMSDN